MALDSKSIVAAYERQVAAGMPRAPRSVIMPSAIEIQRQIDRGGQWIVSGGGRAPRTITIKPKKKKLSRLQS